MHRRRRPPHEGTPEHHAVVVEALHFKFGLKLRLTLLCELQRMLKIFFKIRGIGRTLQDIAKP